MTDRPHAATLAHLTEALQRGAGQRDIMPWVAAAGMGADGLLFHIHTNTRAPARCD